MQQALEMRNFFTFFVNSSSVGI